jgi:hypothetical protein
MMVSQHSKKILLPNGHQISQEVWERHQVPNPTTGCIEWAGVQSNVGFGFIGWTTPGHGSRETGYFGMMTVHRAALMLKLGRAIAPGMNANHSCHNKLCIQESHLSEGTQREKIHAMMQDGITKFGTNQRPYNHRQLGRAYRYSEEEIAWCRDAEIPAIAKRYNFDTSRAAGFRQGMREGYRWLPWPNRDQAVSSRPGRRPKSLTTEK